MTVKEVCILTVSDRCSRGEAEDTSGQALAEFFSDKAAFKVTQRFCVPDEKKEIIDALDRWVKMKVNLILTTGKGPRRPWRFKQSNRILGSQIGKEIQRFVWSAN